MSKKDELVAKGEDAYGVWQSFRVLGIEQKLRWIEPGEFMMGSPEEEAERGSDEKQHRVVLSRGYWLADTACTQALWEAVMGNNPSSFRGEDRPVENVSWEDVQGFIERLNDLMPGRGFRLPTEAEWEYACRAGTTTPFWFGDQITPEQVNYDGNYPYADGDKGQYRKETVEVKALPCNGWGLYQMHGNVWEWCQDRYGDYGRVLRGGSWFDFGWLVRSALRSANDPGIRDCFVNYGFRLAREESEGRVLRGGCWIFFGWSARSAQRLTVGPGSRGAATGFRLARDDMQDEVLDPTGSEEGGRRVLRGGSWILYGRSARSAQRDFSDPGYRFRFFGFRLAQNDMQEEGRKRVLRGGSWINFGGFVRSAQRFADDPGYHEDLTGFRLARLDPTGPEEGRKRVLRGGCWIGNGGLVRSAQRLALDPGLRLYDFGLRPARKTLGEQAMRKISYEVNGVSFDMIQIPSGKFLMGSPEQEIERDYDESQHEVAVDQFQIGETPVTQELWEAVMGANPSYFKGNDLPVESVSWEDAIEFITRLNKLLPSEEFEFALPTEEQWEYACRAGTTTVFYWGDTATSKNANFDGNFPYPSTLDVTEEEKIHVGQTTPVKSYPPNPWGLYDMLGNVWEWTGTQYEFYEKE